MFTGIYGSMGLSWGWNWLKNSFFPFFLFIFSIPLGNHSDLITTRLQLLVSWLVEVVCHNILGIDIVREGNQLYDAARTYQYEVAAACSGIRSLFTIFLLATAFGFLTFRSLGKRLFMMSLAVPFAVLGNLIRMMCIVLFATLFGKEWGDKVHENAIASIIPYIPAILGLLWIGGWLERREKRQHPSV
jgi:exosortase